MSAFSPDWNGPQGAQPRGLDLYQLTEAYNRVLTTLNEHVSSQVGHGNSGENVHNIKAYLDAAIQELRDLIPDTSGLAIASDVDRDYVKKEALGSYAQKSELQDFVRTQALNDYLQKNRLSEQQVIVDIQDDIENLARALSGVESWKDAETLIVDALKANGYIEGALKCDEVFEFKDKHIAAGIGGTNVIGIYYLLGQLKGKAGSVRIKYLDNSKAFTASVIFTESALSVVTDNEKLKGLCFLIVKNNDNKYLAVQSTDWMSNFASTDGYGLFDHLEFNVNGCDFIPAGSAGWESPNGSCEVVCECLSKGPGLAFSALSTTTLGVQICREAHNPYLTLDDVKALDKVGLISQWPDFDPDTGVAINVPEGYHACDGTSVLETDDVDDEFRERWTTYPVFDYSIIKTKSTLKVALDEPVRSSLAEAVCTLHGIKFYYGFDTLPDTAQPGEPVVVQSGNKFSVYTYTENDGWKEYSTRYSNIDQTIAAVAAIIAAEHHADVYTVYSSVLDLPTGAGVATDTLAIVFDGEVYSVYQYDGSNWTEVS